jgi:hypothetical protein
MYRNRGDRVLRNFLTAFLLTACWAGLQPAECQVVPAEQLKIVVKQGEGDSHRPGDKTGSTIVVQVLNEVELPQPEADVNFSSDQEGASVLFDGDKTFVTVRSDAQGMARVPGVRGNKVKGAVTIRVTASFEGKSGTTPINQINVSGPILNRTRGGILAGALAATGVILYEVFKPGPPTATINSPTATTTSPQTAAPKMVLRVGR